MPDLRRWIRDDFGLDVTELTQIHHGADTGAEVWRADQYAVKWTTGGTTAAYEVTSYLAEAGVRGVPAPIRTPAGALWTTREGRRLSLTPWIDGARASETGLTTDQWRQYGGLLAEVHSQAVPDRLRALLPPLNPINARMPALAGELGQRFATRAPEDDLEAELATTWLAHQGAVDALVERTAQPPAASPRVICHADPHLGNVLVTPEQLYLIDWDDAVLAPIEQDLLFMLGGMGSLGPTTEADQAAFFAGYGSAALDPTRLTYYRSARALEDVALWAEQAITGPDRAESLEILQEVLGPDGLVVQALS
ncbi:aminoglycoside O-phosphotransferase APH(9)-Ia [Kribbella ginsengisoli]|uniref:Aminoglycoside O-phosphotransferase APH(9)-Ia n=1 Tax=Kribbella ginsengisoli TaxID=363865 RepID=A0ABP6WTQ2_9ACTN